VSSLESASRGKTADFTTSKHFMRLYETWTCKTSKEFNRLKGTSKTSRDFKNCMRFHQNAWDSNRISKVSRGFIRFRASSLCCFHLALKTLWDLKRLYLWSLSCFPQDSHDELFLSRHLFNRSCMYWPSWGSQEDL